jgi:hypothetical protein
LLNILTNSALGLNFETTRRFPLDVKGVGKSGQKNEFLLDFEPPSVFSKRLFCFLYKNKLLFYLKTFL